MRGVFVAIELKATVRDKLRPMQEYNLEKIRKAGGIALVVHGENWQACLTFLETLGETSDGKSVVRTAEGS